MGLPKFEYLVPKTVARAVALQKDGARFLAGGTDLLVAMKQRRHAPSQLIDLGGISELKKVKWNRLAGLSIGSMVTLTHLAENQYVKQHFSALSQIIQLVSAPQLRNMGTIGGNLCLDTRCYYYNQSLFLKKRWAPCLKIGGRVCHVVKGRDTCFAVYSGDMAAPLMSLGAKVRVADPVDLREIPLKDLFSGSGINPHTLRENEVLTRILIPALPVHSGFSYQKLRLRDTLDFPLLGAAVWLQLEGKDGPCLDFRLVISAVGPSPLMVDEAADIMRGKTVTPKLIEEVSRLAEKMSHPVANTAAEPRYRRQMARVLTKKAVYEALNRI